MTDLHVPQWTVTDRLIKAREAEHLTQHDMAERFGVNTKTIGRWERGLVSMKGYQVQAWAMACGVPVAWLLTGIDDLGPAPEGGRTMPVPPSAWITGMHIDDIAALNFGAGSTDGLRQAA